MKLAINGGKPVKPKQNHLRHISPIFGREEIYHLERVIHKGVLSDFIAGWGEYFNGGEYVKEFEKQYAKKMGTEFAVSFNSATSALHAAIFACDIGTGDEVIVPPWTMTATVTSVLMQNAIPVFSDISYGHYCHSVEELKKNIYIPDHPNNSTLNGTKAILTVNLLGGMPELDRLKELADANNVYLIEDSSQAPLGKWKNKNAGTYGDIGIFSLNCHKVINCGEGGVLVTNSEELALKAKLVRNHAEAVIDGMEEEPFQFPNMLGYNYRMTELQAAVALAQLGKIDAFNEERIRFSHYLTKRLRENDCGLNPFEEPEDMRHVYYAYPAIFDTAKWHISKGSFIKAVQEEGFLEIDQAPKPIHLMKIFQRKQVYANSHFPFVDGYCRSDIRYDEGICPVAEDLYFNKYVTIYNLNRHGMTEAYVDQFIEAVVKVFENQEELL
jgi:perosamine synthetase